MSFTIFTNFSSALSLNFTLVPHLFYYTHKNCFLNFTLFLLMLQSGKILAGNGPPTAAERQKNLHISVQVFQFEINDNILSPMAGYPNITTASMTPATT
jgi:hypothetical protein